MKYLLVLAALLPLAAGARGEAPMQKVTIVAKKDSEWHSYRHAYSAAAFFEKFTRTRPLIQAHMQIRPNRKDLPMDGMRIELEGETSSADIAVDRIGRATVPMLKQAYVEDAVLRLNRLKGNYHFSGRYSIREREDGVYRVADLRAACDQLLSAQRESGYRLRLIGKKCAGVSFIYALADAGKEIRFTDGTQRVTVLAAVDGQPFENDTMGLFKVARFRFADWPAEGTVTTSARPIAIGTVYD
ncbi:hypothetical protein C7C56_019320 [Massilia glaciei]|uniref:Uncharacterized protein n=2 Tax=Massilia glaciei TaxID=1524097 RepID=A0A2U2HGX8_9BURK|nr:hypothetical protein C7C56_019320 [Massilia glaciei]